MACGSGKCSEEPNVVSFVLHWQWAQADPTQPPPPQPQTRISLSQSGSTGHGIAGWMGSLHQFKQGKQRERQTFPGSVPWQLILQPGNHRAARRGSGGGSPLSGTAPIRSNPALQCTQTAAHVHLNWQEQARVPEQAWPGCLPCSTQLLLRHSHWAGLTQTQKGWIKRLFPLLRSVPTPDSLSSHRDACTGKSEDSKAGQGGQSCSD